MKGLVLQLDTSLPGTQEIKNPVNEDLLGSMLTAKFTQWSTARRHVEERWLEDLSAYNQKNDTTEAQLSKFHSHIYIGMTRTKCNSAYSRLSDLMFQGDDKHWQILPSPVPQDQANDPVNAPMIDDMKARAEKMTTEISDQMVDLKYENHLKSAILEACIIGTGCVKGVIPGVKKLEKWAYITNPETGVREWDIEKTEIPTPVITSPTIFDVYPDPFANSVEDMSGVFERHILNRSQLSDFRDDPRFNADKIKEILTQTDKGNHEPEWHETQRRMIARITNLGGSESERYDVLEYWGQASGRLLMSAGVKNVEEDNTYWANVWTCSGKTLLAKLIPMKKQRIPYNFFVYTKIPHQFWGVSPARMCRSTQLAINGLTRAMLDGAAMSVIPQIEVNVHMLKDGQDPSVVLPGQVWLRDSGDPSTPCIRFYQPDIPTGQLLQLSEMFENYLEDETQLPKFTYGDTSEEKNKTFSGLSLQMNAATLPIKMVAKNLEDGLVLPLVTSWFDFLMEFSDREDIKGDLTVMVRGTSALLTKERHGQQLMQFLNLTANPMDMQIVDRKYLLQEISINLEIDTQLAVPDQMPEQPGQEQPQESQLDLARAALLNAQKEKTEAESVEIRVKSQFSAVQTAGAAIQNSEILPTSDELLLSAGYKDSNGSPLATMPQGPIQQPIMPEQNTSPGFPANIQSPQEEQIETPEPIEMNPSPATGLNAGIETVGLD
jgi:hypothetical protein